MGNGVGVDSKNSLKETSISQSVVGVGCGVDVGCGVAVGAGVGVGPMNSVKDTDILQSVSKNSVKDTDILQSVSITGHGHSIKMYMTWNPPCFFGFDCGGGVTYGKSQCSKNT